MLVNDGLYIPADIVKGRHIYFAADNVDFKEDTCDGKRTLHATALAIYQMSDPADPPPKLVLSEKAKGRTLENLPSSVTKLLECPNPSTKPNSPMYKCYSLCTSNYPPLHSCDSTGVWLLCRTLLRLHNAEHMTYQPEITPTAMQCLNEGNESLLEDLRPDQELKEHKNSNAAQLTMGIPTWSGYHSVINQKMAVTQIGTAPLIAAPAHEWKTLLTVLMQAQGITAKVIGSDRKTVISLDMGLYKPAKQLQMARNDLDNVILRAGELHIVMAQLRTIGAFIENNGIDLCWTESDIYGSVSVKAILDGNHVKRGIEAHVVTLQALAVLYSKAFFKEHPHLLLSLTNKAKELNEACMKEDTVKINDTHTKILEMCESLQLIQKMTEFDVQNRLSPIFQVTLHYMKMVMEMLLFIRSVRTGHWDLHLLALETFCKYFFAHDKLVYARMIPLYLADMKSLEESDQGIYREFQQGNWVVNKNTTVPFCGIGADHALEQVNRSMKVPGGLVGITLNVSSRTKFFLISAELARLAEEAREMAGISPRSPLQHHDLSKTVIQRQERNISNLASTLSSFTNPFLSGEQHELFNLVTKELLQENVKKDVCNQSEIGQKLLETFVEERIRSGKINLWAPMKRRRMLTWKIAGKSMKFQSANKLVELKEDRSLFARMLVVSKSRPQMDLKETIGEYEFTVVPRSLFAADGTMLHCESKSDLMGLLEKLAKSSSAPKENITYQNRKRVVIVDAMGEVQKMGKPGWVKSCSDLADHFSDHIFDHHGECEELHLFFDRYDMKDSLKTATRVKRLRGQPAVRYHISDNTIIDKVSMKRLLSHDETKAQLTAYFASKILVKAKERSRCLVVAWENKCDATHRIVSHLHSVQEEADTKLILHAFEATVSGATSITIVSPDTDVLILSLRRYPELCQNTYFVTGAGKFKRTINLKLIYENLGSSKAAALPAFHAFTGADICGSFAGKGKLTCWKIFMSSSEEVINDLTELGTTTMPSVKTIKAIQEFVCRLYQPKTRIKLVKDLRWWLFKKKQAQSERLPPTYNSLSYAILRAHYQTMIWNHDSEANPLIPSAEEYGWKKETGAWLPIMNSLKPAPDAVLDLIHCNCEKNKCSTMHCNCKKSNLTCTDLCTCCENENHDCQNTEEPYRLEESESEGEGENDEIVDNVDDSEDDAI